MKFRTKSVVKEAINFTGGFSADEMGVEWGEEFVKVCSYSEGANTLTIKTLEGVMTANLGDWIIKGLSGEFYPCKPDIFEKTYEAVE